MKLKKILALVKLKKNKQIIKKRYAGKVFPNFCLIQSLSDGIFGEAQILNIIRFICNYYAIVYILFTPV